MKKKPKARAKAKIKNWRSCTGVNAQTGRVRRGYRTVRGQCPIPTHASTPADLVSSASSAFLTLGRARRRRS